MMKAKTHKHSYDVHPTSKTHACCTQCGFAPEAALLVRFKSIGWAVGREQLSETLKAKLVTDGLLKASE